MEALAHHVRILAAKKPEVRKDILNSLVSQAFQATDPTLHRALLEYNAKLFTSLREEKVWP